MLAAFADLDPTLQLLTVAVTVAIVSIASFKFWRYLKKRRMRSRAKVWTVY
jgi:hypothetical protein